MNKPKNFFFTLVIAIIMLFILGNWVTSVQATNIAFGATPVPTNTPSYPPDTPPGEVPSVEKQEELKAVVQSYVEARYRALSISDAEDFKQNVRK